MVLVKSIADMRPLRVNDFVQAAAVFGILLVVSQMTGEPDNNRWTGRA